MRGSQDLNKKASLHFLLKNGSFDDGTIIVKMYKEYCTRKFEISLHDALIVPFTISSRMLFLFTSDKSDKAQRATPSREYFTSLLHLQYCQLQRDVPSRQFYQYFAFTGRRTLRYNFKNSFSVLSYCKTVPTGYPHLSKCRIHALIFYWTVQ